MRRNNAAKYAQHNEEEREKAPGKGPAGSIHHHLSLATVPDSSQLTTNFRYSGSEL
nr:hypothetical protein I308_00373 [Cryptococcus tetragattii IND107]